MTMQIISRVVVVMLQLETSVQNFGLLARMLSDGEKIVRERFIGLAICTNYLNVPTLLL